MAKKTTASKSKASKTTSRKTKASPKSRKASKTKSAPAKKETAKAEAGEQEVTIDRRREDSTGTAAPKVERRKKVQRRRQIDPTTCERDYTDKEVEFMNALDEYKRTSGRMFPTCSEVLEVIRGLGYVQLTPAEQAARGDQGDALQEGSAAEFDMEHNTEDAELELAGHSESEF